MSATTVYDVRIQYSLDDRAANGLSRIGKSADEAARGVDGLKEGLKTVAEMMLAREAFHKGKELFIDLNSEFEQMKLSMAAVTSYNLGAPFEQAAEKTDRLIDGWQKFSQQTTLTTKQFVEFGSSVEGAMLNAGGSMKELDEFVKRGAVVGNILAAGHAGGLGYVATEFREALSGMVRKGQMFNQQLIGPEMKKMGKDIEEFNKLSAEERKKIIISALNDPAWDAAIKKQAGSFAGVTSTFEDTMQIAGMRIGKHLFTAISEEVGKINQWLKNHEAEVEEFGEKLSRALMEGFKFVKDGIGFIIEHKDLLLTIFGGWAASKVLGGPSAMLGGATSGMLGGKMVEGGAGLGANLHALGDTSRAAATQMAILKERGVDFASVLQGGMTGALVANIAHADKLNTSMMVLEGAVSRLPGPIGLVATGLLGLHSALQFLADFIDKEHKKRVEGTLTDSALIANRLKDRDNLKYAVSSGQREAAQQISGEMIQVLRSMGLVDKNLTLADRATLISKAASATGYSVDAAKFADYAAEAVAAFQSSRLYSTAAPTPPDIDTGKIKDKTNVNVTIHKIEVASDDPDRFVLGMVKSFDKAARNPTMAQSAIHGG